ncbi:energy transducer TonB [Sediminitomix flava]|uniref:Protein TonB n=1 Tax=Sediminitomix flava TaxID=379075 RepID=A0A315YY12_SEDFL|nr:energy transducer TonB [Sediminitomix flava]PWJ34192.1 protein TonB [Sediminitomix flava]
MRKELIFLFLCLIPSIAFSQNTPSIVYKDVDQPAHFKGGFLELYQYFKDNLEYPQEARDAKIQGNVKLEFVVDKDGSIKNIVIDESLGHGCDEEAVRLLSGSPKWVPAQLNGKAVAQKQTTKIEFLIPDKKLEARGFALKEKEENFEEFEVEEETLDEVFEIVEDPASFEGGVTAFLYWVGRNLKYPQEARRMGVEGKVYIQFIIDKDGSVTDVKTVRGIGAGCDAEAERVIRMSPKWKPGFQRGKPVKQKMVVPINFSLGSSSKKDSK